MTGHGMAGPGGAGHGKAGTAIIPCAGQGGAWLGSAGPGMAGHGRARRGKIKQTEGL